MTQWLDDKYIRLISSHLKRFKQKGNDLYNFRCPFCGDSKKKESKARGYLYAREGRYFFKCQNCGYSTNLFGLLKHIDIATYRQYVLETFANQKVYIHEDKQQSEVVDGGDSTILLDSISMLPESHFARLYLTHRCIPSVFFDLLYFAPSFKDFTLAIKPKEDKELFDDARIIIPIYDEEHRLQGFQGRALSASKAKYITIKISEDAIKLIGLERIDKSQKIYVCEGPIDSFFLPNAVATGDSDLLRSSKYFSQDQLVLVFDNEYHNKALRKTIDAAINANFKVCVFPRNIKEKDINEMIMNGMTQSGVKQLIDDNTFQGLRAKMELDLR